MRLKRSRESGDTIVEIMIVLAILGFAISIAYSTATKSLLASRAAQESSQATALVQGQLEGLRALSANKLPSPVPNDGTGGNYIYQAETPLGKTARFCIMTDVTAGGPKMSGLTDSPHGFATVAADNAMTNYALYPRDTTDPTFSTPCIVQSGGLRVYLSIAPQDNDGFLIKAVWDDAQGTGQSSTTLFYRAHRLVGL